MLTLIKKGLFMKYLSIITACVFIAASLNAANPSRKLDLDLKSDLGCIKGQYQLTYNQKHWSLTEDNITVVLKLISESDNMFETKIKIFKNPEKSTDQATLIAQPSIVTIFGQQATITCTGTDSYLSLAFTINKE